MKKIFGLLFLLPLFAVAQKVITHTVGPKESLSSIGRLYNINGRELANYNKIDYDKGLTIGQVLKIPATAKTTDAPVPAPAPVKVAAPVKEVPVKETPVVKSTPAAGEKGEPIYHTVGKKETLYHISTLYNKVPIADLKKWNHLSGDALSEGSKLIVGYSGAKQQAAEEPAVTKTVPVVKEPAVIKTPTVSDIAKNKDIEGVKQVEIKKEEPKNIEPVKPAPTRAGNFNGGIFKNVYESQTSGRAVVNENGAGGIFKSTSGWEDGKYYCLHNNATAGTVIKVTNTANGKTIYAKVLDMIPDIKQNNGLIIRISNAAADVLGIADSKLDCTLNYSK